MRAEGMSGSCAGEGKARTNNVQDCRQLPRKKRPGGKQGRSHGGTRGAATEGNRGAATEGLRYGH